jgi:hypothetical protein
VEKGIYKNADFCPAAAGQKSAFFNSPASILGAGAGCGAFLGAFSKKAKLQGNRQKLSDLPIVYNT